MQLKPFRSSIISSIAQAVQWWPNHSLSGEPQGSGVIWLLFGISIQTTECQAGKRRFPLSGRCASNQEPIALYEVCTSGPMIERALRGPSNHGLAKGASQGIQIRKKSRTLADELKKTERLSPHRSCPITRCSLARGACHGPRTLGRVPAMPQRFWPMQLTQPGHPMLTCREEATSHAPSKLVGLSRRYFLGRSKRVGCDIRLNHSSVQYLQTTHNFLNILPEKEKWLLCSFFFFHRENWAHKGGII